jgi:hypothetical protein
MASQPARAAARIHWLLAGRFSPSPAGGSFVASPKDFDALLGAHLGEIRVRVPDRLGAGDTREVTLAPRSLRTFTLAGVVEAIPELQAVRALTERPPSAADFVAAVEKLVGKGRLSAACASGPVRDALDAAIFGTALDVLCSEPVRTLEASWRGLRLLLGACPEGSDIQVEVLDAAPADIASTIRARPAHDAFDEPDALIVTESVKSWDLLASLADLGEEMLAPCVAAPSPALLGASNVEELAALAERPDPFPEDWEKLRATGAARWLCAAVNPVALHAEGAGAYRRVCFGSPAWAIAAMLSTSYRAQGAFARAVGKAGALTVPATWTIPAGPQRGKVAPTEAFLPIPAQTALAERGIVALGSVVNSDRVILAVAPMVARGSGVVPLPAQMLTGRIVRFAQWARGQIDPAQSPDEVSTLLAQAAALFLFPGMSGAAAIGARVKGEGEDRVLEFGARVDPSHAMVPLEIAFELPL